MSILDSLLGRNTVGIFDAETAAPVFEGAEIMRIQALPAVRLTQYPVESGQTRTDGHRVRLLQTCTVDFIIPRNVRDVYADFKRAQADGTKFTIQSRADTMTPMVISEMPREEQPEVEGAVGMQVRFQEWLEVVPEYGQMPARVTANPIHSDTVAGGQSAGSAVSDTQRTTLLNQWFGGLL
ncbi:MAG TPA: hypothetical protein VKY62_05960 [Devosia sp.]|nr:hypothetical protein [Devosia sp.]